jgi:drug/metabolite transporter (DMT)-like permease
VTQPERAAAKPAISAPQPPAEPSAPAAALRRPIDALAVTVLVVCCVLWGLNQAVAKLSLGEVPPLTMAALRSLGAAALVALWARGRGIALWSRDGTAFAGALAAALFAVEFAFIFIGLQYTSASRMAVFIYLAPFVVAIGMPFIAPGERLGPVGWAGLLVAFLAVGAAFAEGLSSPAVGPLQWLGDALGIAAAVLWGLTTLVIRGSRLSQAAPEKTLFVQLAGSGLLLAAAAAAAGESPGLPWSAQTWGLVGFQTVVVTFASYLMWFWLVRHYPATRLSAWLMLTPVFGLLFGVLLLNEPLTLRLVLALVTVMAGIAMVSLSRAR